MRYYRAPDNSIHHIDPAYEFMLPVGSVPISEEDVAEFLAANTPPPVEPIAD
jgi:hypothetical protein